MLEYFQYGFFTNALTALAICGVCAGIIGTYIITRRMASIAGGITHACFGGLGLGYFLGINPLITAAAFAISSSAAVEWIEKKWDIRSDSAIAVIWAIGMALGVLFVFLTPGYVPELNGFLFGNILTVSQSDIIISAVYACALTAFMALFHRRIIAISFDADFARVLGLKTRAISYAMTVFIAIGIVLTIRLTGIMLLMSVLSLPIMTAELFSRRYVTIMVCSGIICILAGIAGLCMSALIDVPCSALIVLILATAFIAGKTATTLLRKK